MPKEYTSKRSNDIDKLVGKSLKHRRIILGMSQKEIGIALGVTIQQVQKYESTKNRISSGKLYALSKFLKVPIDYFYIHHDGRDVDNNIDKFSEDITSDISYERQTVILVKEFVKIKNLITRTKIIELIKMIK